MCGILGIISKTNGSKIEVANQMMHHRGPDDSGFFQEGVVALAHQRLSILDLSAKGHQPMISKDGNLVIVFNGEIYNHLDIRLDLKSKYAFESTTDTETLLYAYQEYGVDIFKELNGIFAFAIYDKRAKKIIVCRDQFGIKPLYLYTKGEEIYFASELKTFLKIPDWDKTYDYSAFSNYLNFLWSPGTQTPYKFVEKILPGHFVTIDLENLENIRSQKYYEIPFDGTRYDYSEKEWIEKVDTAFTKAIERQLLSDVPIGFFLSGGLDSSLIVAKARALMGVRIPCYTINTDLSSKGKEGFTNDLFYAKKVAKYLDVDLEIVEAQIDIVDEFDKMIWHLDEPQADAAPLNVLNICRRAREKGNVVLLGGAGGDDLFSGYRRHQALQYEKYFKLIPSSIGRLLNNSLSLLSSNNANIRRLRKLTSDLDKTVIDRIVGYYRWLPLATNKSLFSNDHLDKIANYDPNNILKKGLENIQSEKDHLNQLLFLDMKYFLTDHNLNYTDKLSMAVGVESRVPFLDLDLVNLSTKVPIELKLKGNETKYLLKKLAEKYLPKEVIYRPKTGFGAPIRKWITDDLKDVISNSLSKKNIEEQGIFDYAQVQKLIENNRKGKIDASYPIWALLAIESWIRQFK